MFNNPVTNVCPCVNTLMFGTNNMSSANNMYGTNNMYDAGKMYQCPYSYNMPMYNSNPSSQSPYGYIPNYFVGFDQGASVPPLQMNIPGYEQCDVAPPIQIKDYGPEPFAVNINQAAKQNNTFRTALWTGNHLQLTLMSINPGEEIGLENHPDLDQFIRIEDGQGLVMMGDKKDNLDFQAHVHDNYAFIIPAGKWHNLINTGINPIKLYSIYAPPQHPHGTVHKTKADALAAERKTNPQVPERKPRR